MEGQRGLLPLSGWDPNGFNLGVHRSKFAPSFTTDARPFADMVDTLYLFIQNKCEGRGRHIPRSIFRYYCLLLWHHRTLIIQQHNGVTLTKDHMDFLSGMRQMNDLNIPSQVAQYLTNMGNFTTQNGDEFYFYLIAHKFVTMFSMAPVQNGWLETSDNYNRVTGEDFWTYSQIPVPGVLITNILNEANATKSVPSFYHNLDYVAPRDTNIHTRAFATENIIGWDVTPLAATDASWASTFQALRFSSNTLPYDMRGQYCFSASVMRWVSNNISILKHLEVCKGIELLGTSARGHPMQVHFLTCPSGAVLFPSNYESLASNKCNGSRSLKHAIRSSFPIERKDICPAMAFGYRLERTLISLGKNDKGQEEFTHQSNYQPWVYANFNTNSTMGLSPKELANMNRTFNFGDQALINAARFSTDVLDRDIALNFLFGLLGD